MANYNIDAIYNGSTSLPGTERIRIDGSGNVGINQSSPAYKLDVNGTARIANDMLATGNITIGKAAAYLILDGTNSDAEIYWRANSSNRWAAGMNVGDATENFNIYNYTTATTNLTILKANGNVGIGSTAPAYKLDVNGSIGVVGLRFVDQSTSYFRIFEPAGNIAIYLGNAADPANYYDNSTHFFRNRGGSSTYAVIEGNGNLGIGTTSVTAPLHIYRASNPWIRLNGGGNYSYIRFDDGTSNGYLFKNTSSDTSNGALAGAMYTYTDSGKAFQHIHGGTPLFTILSGGNVGIGTTSPSTKLHVVGNADIGDSTADTGIIVRHGAGSAQYGRIRFYDSGGNNIHTIHSFPTAWQGGTFLNSSAGALNLTGYNGVTFGAWNSVDVAFAANGNNYFKGNVGIGVTTAATKFVVSADATDSDVGQLRVIGSTSTAKMINVGYHTTNNYGFISSLIAGSGYSALSLQPNGGNVGIATVSPDVRLHVINGTTKLNKNNYKTTTAYSTADLVLGDDVSSRTGYAGNGSNLVLHANGTTSITFLDQTRNLGEITYSNKLFTIGGDIGWGTASVLFPGTVNFGANIYHSIGGQKFFAGSGGNYAYLYTGGVALNFLNSTDTSTLMTVLNDGNVGIGTTSPVSKVHISGSGQTIMRLDSDTTTNVSQFQIKAASDAVLIMGMFGGSAASTNFGVTAAGQAYFGTTTLGSPHPTSLVIGTASPIPTIFSTNNVEKMRIASDGNVGIGTSSPTQALHITSTNSGNNGLTIATTSATGNPQVRFLNSAGAEKAAITYISSADAVYFYTAASASNLLNFVGSNIGIGTTSPGAKLDVNGDVYVSPNTAGKNTFILSTNASNDARLLMRSDVTTKVDIQANGTSYFNGGNVGVGTATPFGTAANRTVLSVNGTTDVSLNIGSGGSQRAYLYGVSSYAELGTIGSLPLTFAPNNSEKMRLTSDGNLGIGTTSPTQRLHVLTTGGSTTAPNIVATFQANTATTILAGGGTAIKFVGVSSGGNLQDYDQGMISTLGYADNNRHGMQFWVKPNASTVLTVGQTIDSNGNVGIGTSSPAYKLDVNTANDSAIRIRNGGGGANNGLALSVGSGSPWLDITEGVEFRIKGNTYANIGTWNSGNNTKLLIDSNGNIGIGTTSPNAKLVIDSSEPRFRLNISGTNHIILNHDGSTAILRTESNTPFTFGTNGTEKMRIAAGGNVGIGTSNPISLLQIAGTTSMFPTYDSVTGYSYFLRMGYDTSGSYDYTIKRNGTTGFLEFNGTQGSPYVSYVFAGGDVYSGASGGTVGGFYFNSSSHGIRRATGTNDVYCFTTSGTLYLGAGGSSTTHVRVLSGGDVGIGVSPSYKLDVNGNIHGTGFPTSSDVRFKKNITPLQNSLEKIKKLQGVKYEWNEFVNSRRDGYKLNIPIIGLIAQDVEQVVPEIVDHWKLSDDCQDARSIDYPRLIPLLIEAIKEQQNQIEELRNEIKSLKSN